MNKHELRLQVANHREKDGTNTYFEFLAKSQRSCPLDLLL